MRQSVSAEEVLADPTTTALNKAIFVPEKEVWKLFEHPRLSLRMFAARTCSRDMLPIIATLTDPEVSEIVAKRFKEDPSSSE